MPGQGYYGGYSLIRTSANPNGGASAKAGDKTTAKTTTTTGGAGLSRMNFASCNSDWLPSLGKPSATKAAPSSMAAVDAEERVNVARSIARAAFLQALLGMQSFYRGAPLRAINNSNNNNNTKTSNAASLKAIPTSSANAVPTTADSTNNTGSVSNSAQMKKKIPLVPTPIGGDTWCAISDTAHTAKTGVVAARHASGGPVGPRAIGVLDADAEMEFMSLRRGSDPLFRDLITMSSPLEASGSTTFQCGTRKVLHRGPVSVDDVLFVKHQRHPIPPAPISASSLMSSREEGEVRDMNVSPLREEQPESPELFFEEGMNLPRALHNEVHGDSVSGATPPNNTELEDTSIPLLFYGKDDAAHRSAYSNSLLLGEDGDICHFDDEEEEDALERIKRVINVVMSVSNADTPSAETDMSCKATKGVDFDMDWAKAQVHGDPQTSFFHGI